MDDWTWNKVMNCPYYHVSSPHNAVLLCPREIIKATFEASVDKPWTLQEKSSECFGFSFKLPGLKCCYLKQQGVESYCWYFQVGLYCTVGKAVSWTELNYPKSRQHKKNCLGITDNQWNDFTHTLRMMRKKPRPEHYQKYDKQEHNKGRKKPTGFTDWNPSKWCIAA